MKRIIVAATAVLMLAGCAPCHRDAESTDPTSVDPSPSLAELPAPPEGTWPPCIPGGPGCFPWP